MNQPQAIHSFEVYEGATNFVGVAQATLPNVQFIVSQINGAGIQGNIDSVLPGLMEAMELGLNFRSSTDAAAKLVAPDTHQVELRAAEQHWDTVNHVRKTMELKYVITCVPKQLTAGNLQVGTTPDASGTYSVFHYEAYRDGKQLWAIDPLNYICTVNGVDYLAEVRKAVGK